MNENFHSKLNQYSKSHDIANANRVIMEELGKILIKDREDFITLLKYSDVNVPTEASDAELINLFINNIGKNHKLLIGASFLTNQHNKQMGFDGEEKISDEGVKTAHQTMFSYFDSGAYGEDMSYAGGDPISAIADAVGGLTKLGSKGIDARQKKKFFGSDLAAKKEESKQQLIQSVLEQRRAQQESVQKQQIEKQKQKKIIIIASASVIGIGLLIGLAIYLKNKK